MRLFEQQRSQVLPFQPDGFLLPSPNENSINSKHHLTNSTVISILWFNHHLTYATMTSTHRPKPPASAAASLDLLTVTSTELQDLLANGSVTSLDLVDVYLDQIEHENHNGLKLNAMISITPYDVLRQTARDLDREREQGVIRSLLHGILITVKVRDSHSLKVLVIC